MLNSFPSFGVLLKQLRKRAGMTQGDLAAAIGYSISLVCALEQNRRLPDMAAVIQTYIPALALQEEPHLAAQLVELAAIARGERPPSAWTIQRERRVVISETVNVEPHRLPTLPIELIGREQVVGQIGKRLLGHRGRLLTLVGPPGIGKTTLALAVAAQLQYHYQDGAAFVALAAVSDPVLMAAAIATTVGCSDATPKAPKIKLIEYLRHKSLLLVLDNLEQIGEAALLIAELVAECPGLCVLATSRERLHLRAEQRYQVPPLALASAVDLFVQRAQVVDADFSLTPQNQPTLTSICQRLDCLPLALELCAAQIDLRSPTQLLTQLQARPLDLLVEGAHDLPPRQRTLRTAIGHSYRLLNEDERTLFRSLGVFVGGFDLSAVESVAAESMVAATRPLNATFHALIGKSLVRAETISSGEQRFLLLETIREFAIEQLQVHGEDALLRQRHYAAYLQLVRTGDSRLRGPEAVTWFRRLESEQDNIRAALQWALDEKRYVDAAWLMVAIHWFWSYVGYSYEGLRWLTQLLPHRRALAIDLRLATLVSFYAVARALEEFHLVERYWDELKQLLEVCQDKLLCAAGWHFISVYAPDFSQAAAAYERSIELARTAGEAPGLGAEFCLFTERDYILVSMLWGYAAFLLVRGQVTLAAPFATESMALFRKRGNGFEIANGLGTLGLLALLQGDLAQAHRHFHEAVTIAAAFNLYDTLGNWQPFLGIVTLYCGDATEARRLLSESMRVCIELRDKKLLARNCTFLAEVALWEGETDEAEQWLAQSLDYHADPRDTTIYQVTRLFVAAGVATAQQKYQRAAMLFGMAEQANSHIHYVYAGPVRAQADAALVTVHEALAAEVFDEAFAMGQQLSLDEAFATLLAPTHVTSTVTLSTSGSATLGRKG